ncbi:MAG: hypothetical protein U0270_12695 [Labilithrix sp.]
MRRLAFLAALLLPSTALAQGTSKAAMAESLFQEARKLLAAGKTSPACSKFKASFLIDPTNGTLLALAHCHQKEGRTASAWAEFQEVATEAKRAGKPDQERYAREQTAVLDKILRRVTIRVQPMDGMKVRVDGVELPPEALGSALPVDPGARVFEVSAPRYVTSTQTIVVEPGPGTTEVTFDPLVAEPVAAPPPALAPAAPPRRRRRRATLLRAAAPRGGRHHGGGRGARRRARTPSSWSRAASTSARSGSCARRGIPGPPRTRGTRR